ncbi:hypothetical protein ABT167_19305 [Streptomyces sp. NPDC001792]|uniref:hypothetical protein n=1 Tax=Streptomyces sp. NPDC001792 TaxID=3154524 RepID=UPI00331AD6EA
MLFAEPATSSRPVRRTSSVTSRTRRLLTPFLLAASLLRPYPCVLAVIGLGVWAISASRVTLGQFLAFAAFLGRRPLQRRDPGSAGFAVQPGGLVLTRALTAPAPTGDDTVIPRC